jgi:hypothetical protein
MLVENGLVQPGETIYLKKALPSYIQYHEDDPTFKATITGKTGQKDGVRWMKDGAEYAVSKLTWKVFKELHPDQQDPRRLKWYFELGKYRRTFTLGSKKISWRKM